MSAPKDKVYMVTGKFALTPAGRLNGEVSFCYFVTLGSMPDNPMRADFTMRIEKLTGLFVAEINFEIVSIEELVSREDSNSNRVDV